MTNLENLRNEYLSQLKKIEKETNKLAQLTTGHTKIIFPGNWMRIYKNLYNEIWGELQKITDNVNLVQSKLSDFDKRNF